MYENPEDSLQVTLYVAFKTHLIHLPVDYDFLYICEN
jgi:hypothetical protein